MAQMNEPGESLPEFWQLAQLDDGRAVVYVTQEQWDTLRACWTPTRDTDAANERHPGYVIGNHWLETAYDRIRAGDSEADVMADYGYRRADVTGGAATESPDAD